MASRVEIMETVGMLTSYYGQVDPGYVKAALAALDDIDYADLETAATEAIKTLKWLPKVSELRDLANQAADDRRDPDANRRFLYWESMQLYNDVLAGRRPETDLERSNGWQHVSGEVFGA